MNIDYESDERMSESSMSRRQKTILISAFAVIVILAAAAAVLLNRRETQSGEKTFTVKAWRRIPRSSTGGASW